MITEDEKKQIKYGEWMLPYIKEVMRVKFGNQYERIDVSWGIPQWYMTPERIKQFPENVCFVILSKDFNKLTCVPRISRDLIVEASVEANILFEE